MNKATDWRAWNWLLVAVFLVVLAGGAYFWSTAEARRTIARQQEIQVLSQQLRQSLEGGDFSAAADQSARLLELEPQSVFALLGAAEAAAQAGDLDAAIAYCDRVPADSSPESAQATWIAGELLFRQGKLQACEQRMLALLRRNPQHLEGRRRLIYLLGLSGRRWEAEPHLLLLVRQGQFDLEGLIFLGNSETVVDFRAELESFQRLQPSDPLVQLGFARLAIQENQVDEAERALARIVKQHPDLAEAQARYGEALLAGGKLRELLHWQAQLPVAVEFHPQIWMVRGLLAEQLGSLPVAVHCFGQVLQRAPDHRLAHFELARLFEELGQAEIASRFSQRHQLLADIGLKINAMYGKRPSFSEMKQVARLARELGRMWEAWGWYSLIATQDRSDRETITVLGELQLELGKLPVSKVAPSANLAALVDLQSFPRDDAVFALREGSNTDSAQTVESAPKNPAASLRFVDEASAKGIDFRYFSDHQPQVEGRRIYEFAGGGVAVTDFDLDGWPDLYWTQGCRWPSRPENTEHRNSLYRNMAGTGFDEVTDFAGVGDVGFGQGVAVGDINSDGFPDIYVANIGTNRFYENNGDGTFREVTSSAGMDQVERWTTSCVIADLDGDGLADIYDVNYLTGENIYERICQWQGGKMRICGPATHRPEDDDLWINDGTGRFTNHSEAAGIRLPGGNGLGVVAGDFDGRGEISLFIANDQTANYFFQPLRPATGEGIRFQDRALLKGLAFDREGRGQACMGVAAGDINGDERLDLFVTNYYKESNTLYLSQSRGGYVDATRQANLRDGGFLLLGFGTQFLDADLDGLLDIVVTNGHLDDFTYLGEPFAMPAQVYHNQGDRFRECPAAELGEFFQRTQRGRGLARLDWNRDGLCDVAISHLDAPAALLSNYSTPAGNWIGFELVATQTSRDAIGTRVEISVGDTKQAHQLTAGDGYQASNERKLIVGLGDAAEGVQVKVSWPSGRVQQWGDLASDQEWLLIEGREPVGRQRQ